MIRDLFHSPPIFKANVVLSWKPKDAKGKVRQSEIFTTTGYRFSLIQFSVVDPDPVGSGTFSLIQIRNYDSGTRSIKNERADKEKFYLLV